MTTQETTTAVAVVERPQAPIVPMADMERMSAVIAKSNLFGIKSPDQALALMLIAQAEGRHPAIVARDYDIIQGRPAKKSEAMLRDFLGNGGRIEWKRLDDEAAEAVFSHPQGGSVSISWDMERAVAAGLGDKDMWKKYRRQMLRSRVVSEGIRTVCPSATSGMYVPEEVSDFQPTPPAPATTQRPAPAAPAARPPVVETQHVESHDAPADTQSDLLTVTDVQVKREGKNAQGKPWTLYTVDLSDGRQADAFGGAVIDFAQDALANQSPVVVELEQSKYGFNLKSIQLANAAGQTDAPPPAEGPEEQMHVVVTSIEKKRDTPTGAVYGVETDKGRFGVIGDNLANEINELVGTGEQVIFFYREGTRGKRVVRIEGIPF